MKKKFRLKVIHKATGDTYIPQVKVSWFSWQTLTPERHFPHFVRVYPSVFQVWSYPKEEALEIIEVYKQEQEKKKIIKIEYLNL